MSPRNWQKTISWSKWQTYKQCGLQFDLKYQRRLRGRQNRMLYVVGSAVHNVVEDWYKSGWERNFVANNISDAFASQAAGIGFATQDHFNRLLRRAVRAGLLTVQIFNALKIPQHDPVVEERFNIELPGGGTLIGGPDVFDPVTNTLYDLKTYSSQDHGDVEQLNVYASGLVLQGWDVNRVGFITPLLARKMRTLPISLTTVASTIDNLDDAIAAIEAGIDPIPKEGPWCYFCEFRGTVNCPPTYRPPRDFYKAPPKQTKS